MHLRISWRLLYGACAGAVVAWVPWWLVGGSWLGVLQGWWIPVSAAFMVGVTAHRTPVAWVVGALLGGLSAWGVAVLVAGSDWRLLIYMGIVGQPVYVSGALGLAVGRLATRWASIHSG
jgi:hypothetical protein